MAGRKILYFLGAGASRGAGAVTGVQGGGSVEIPLQADFWQTVLRFATRPERKQIEAFLFRYFAGYRRVPSRTSGLGRTSLLRGIDAEEVFTFISERSQAPSTSPQLKAYVDRIWNLLVAAVGKTFRRFRPNPNTRRVYRALIKNQVRSRDAIVSFNYDTVFETSLPGQYAWHYPCVSDDTTGLRVLKPHGSVNWALEAGKVVHSSGPADHPIIVAPTHLKFVQSDRVSGTAADGLVADSASVGYLDVFPEVQDIWGSMERQMDRAKALVFIGYSFPVADLYFSSVLRSVLASRYSPPQVVIVNPDAVAISSRVQSRFSLSKPLLYFGIEQFVDLTRGRLMAALAL